MHQQLWGYKVEQKIYPGVHEREKLNITALGQPLCFDVLDQQAERMSTKTEMCARTSMNCRITYIEWQKSNETTV